MKNASIKIWYFIILLFFSLNCGTNKLEKKAPPNLQEQAELDMEASKYSDAELKLTDFLLKYPDNYKARSLLAASIAAQGGVIMLKLITQAGTSASSGSGGSGGGSATQNLINFLPDATDTNLALLKRSCTQMNSIPQDLRGEEMKLQGGIFNTMYAMLLLKVFLKNPEKLLDLDPAQAAAILTDLASSLGAASQSFGQSSSGFTQATSQLSSKLERAEGTDSKEKLAAFVSKIQQ